MIKSSILGGASLQIGDYIETEATVLADGKRLLPCDGRLIDEVEYPILASMAKERPLLPTFNQPDLSTNERVSLMGFVSPDGTRILYGDTMTSGVIKLATSNKNNSGVAILYTVPVGTGGLAGGGFSEDNSIITMMVHDTNDNDLHVYTSSDGGATFGSYFEITGVGKPNLSTEHGRFTTCKVSPDGQTIEYLFMWSSVIALWRSTNAGLSFSEVWIAAGSGSNLVGNADANSDFSRVVKVTPLDSFLLIDGVTQALPRPNGYYSGMPVTATMTLNGDIIVYNKVQSNGVIAGITNHEAGLNVIPFFRSNDDGATYEEIALPLPKVVLDAAAISYRTYVNASNDWACSLTMPNIIYGVVMSTVIGVSATKSGAAVAMWFIVADIDTRTILSTTQLPRPSGNQKVLNAGGETLNKILKVFKGVDGYEQLLYGHQSVTSDGNHAELVRITVPAGKRLPDSNLTSSNLTKIVADAP